MFWASVSISFPIRNHRTVSGRGPSPTLYVRRMRTSRLSSKLYRTTVITSSRIDFSPIPSLRALRRGLRPVHLQRSLKAVFSCKQQKYSSPDVENTCCGTSAQILCGHRRTVFGCGVRSPSIKPPGSPICSEPRSPSDPIPVSTSPKDVGAIHRRNEISLNFEKC